jgi:hypothetical protein
MKNAQSRSMIQMEVIICHNPVYKNGEYFFFCNHILFVICTSTFSKLYINIYSGMQKSAQ